MSYDARFRARLERTATCSTRPAYLEKKKLPHHQPNTASSLRGKLQLLIAPLAAATLLITFQGCGSSGGDNPDAGGSEGGGGKATGGKGGIVGIGGAAGGKGGTSTGGVSFGGTIGSGGGPTGGMS